MTTTALDVCAGAGGLSLGLQRAGFDVLGIEQDADACDTHRRHAGPCELADVRTYHPPHAFALVAGGVPCQPFSQAGARAGLDDPRYLVPDFLRIAREASARVVLLENVRGLVRMPRAFRAVLDAFEAEWLTTWMVLDCADRGVPQNRDRLFVVGFRDAADRARWRWPDLTHWPAAKLDGPRERLPDGKKGRRAPGTLSLFGTHHRTVRQALQLGGGAYRSGKKEGIAPGSFNGVRMLDVDRASPSVTGRTNPELLSPLDAPSPCVTAIEHKSAMNGTQPPARRRGASERLGDALLDLPACAIRTNTSHDITPSARSSQRPQAELSRAVGEALDRPSPTITAGGSERHTGGAEPLANKVARDKLLGAIGEAGLADRPATTVQGDPRLSPAGHHDRQQNGAVRLTAAQCAALQGFPVGWTFTGNKSSQHRQVGNALPPDMAEAMGGAVLQAIR